MSEIDRTMDAFASSSLTHARLNNLGAVVEAHDQSPFVATPEALAASSICRVGSITPGLRGVRIDRPPRAILEPYQCIKPRNLQAFTEGGRVLDVGSGLSEFLSYFPRAEERIAVDVHEEHADAQATKGHTSYVAPAHDLSSVEDASIRLLNASNSVPLWAETPWDAAKAYSEYLRVLEPGGVALIDPLVYGKFLADWESYLPQYVKNPETAVLASLHREERIFSYNLAAFAKGIVEGYVAGRIRAATFRTLNPRGTSRLDRYEVPEYIMPQKLS